jgi:hypothetical protein
MSTKNKTIISWQAPEFRHYEKTPGWYASLVAIAILITGFFIIQRDLFAAITIGVLAVFVLLFSFHTPQIINVELSDKGIRFGNLLYPYKQLKHFWIVYNRNHKTLNLHTNTYVNNLVVIELEQQDPEAIREFLLLSLPEHTETNETFSQRISHKLKF